MVGMATFTMNASTTNMNRAATTTASTHQRRRSMIGTDEANVVDIRLLPLVDGAACCGPTLRPVDYVRGHRERMRASYSGAWPRSCPCCPLHPPALSARTCARGGSGGTEASWTW